MAHGRRTPVESPPATYNLSLPYALREQTVRASRPAVVFVPFIDSRMWCELSAHIYYLVVYYYFALAPLSCFRRRCRRVRRCTDYRRPGPLHDHDSPSRICRRGSRPVLFRLDALVECLFFLLFSDGP